MHKRILRKISFQLSLAFLLILFTHLAIAQNPLDVAGQATVTAVQSGNWSANATWGGAIPSVDARVLIPAGITVTVDTEISTPFKSVLIKGGALKFANSTNT